MLSLWRYRYRVRIRYQQIATLNHETNIFDISKFCVQTRQQRVRRIGVVDATLGGGGVLRYWSVHDPYTIRTFVHDPITPPRSRPYQDSIGIATMASPHDTHCHMSRDCVIGLRTGPITDTRISEEISHVRYKSSRTTHARRWFAISE
jgi:hypothetical protein